MTIAAFNQLSGINAVLYYAVDIFKMAGAGEDAALWQGVVVGVTNLVVTVAGMMLIDRAGRRFLMLVGSVGYILSLGTIAAVFYGYGTSVDELGATVLLVALVMFIASHAFGQGAVIWVFIGEMFPNSVRARGQSLGVFAHWVIDFIISLTFPRIAEHSGGHPFAFYCGMMVLQLLWVIFIMPETKGVALEKIQEKLGIPKAA